MKELVSRFAFLAVSLLPSWPFPEPFSRQQNRGGEWEPVPRRLHATLADNLLNGWTRAVRATNSKTRLENSTSWRDLSGLEADIELGYRVEVAKFVLSDTGRLDRFF
jgi:hypothetical protein